MNTGAVAVPVAPALANNAPPTAANHRIADGDDTASNTPRRSRRVAERCGADIGLAGDRPAPTPGTSLRAHLPGEKTAGCAAPPIHTTHRTDSNCSSAAMPREREGRVNQIADTRPEAEPEAAFETVRTAPEKSSRRSRGRCRDTANNDRKTRRTSSKRHASCSNRSINPRWPGCLGARGGAQAQLVPQTIDALLDRRVHLDRAATPRSVSPGHLLVASSPIFEPSPATGDAKSR